MQSTTAQTNLYVIVVTFNMLDGLARTLASIRNVATTFTDVELRAIVVNGNPHDNGHLIVAEYSDIMHKYIAETDFGIYDAMNKGISHLPDDDGYSIFINSDDELLSIPSSISEENYDVIFSDVVSYDQKTNLREVFHVSKKKYIDASNLLRPRIHHQGCFVRNAVLKKYKFDLRVGIRADVLLMGILLKNHTSFFLNEAVALITTGGKSDEYNLSNFLSFFHISDKLGINKIATIILSLPEVVKYTLKGALGKRGILIVRKLKSLLFNSVLWSRIKGGWK